jgi:hypothetical protein
MPPWRRARIDRQRQPVPRVSTRVLPVSPAGEVLLLQDLDPAVPAVLGER